MSCITHFVVLHGVLRRIQMLLTLSRHQMCIIYLDFKVKQQSKEQNQALEL